MDEQARPNLRTNLRDLRLPVAATGAQALASQILRPTALVARLAARGEPLVAGNFGAPLIARYHQLEGAGQLALGVAERFATGASEPPGLDLGLAAAAPPSLEPAPTRGWPAPVASAVPTVARRADPLLGELAAQGWGQPRGAPPDAASSDAPGANTGIIAPPAPGDIRRSPVPAAPLIAAVSTMPTAPALIARAAVPVSAPPLVGTPPPAEPAPAQSTTDADAPAAFSGPPAQVAEDTSFSAVFDAGSTPSEVPAIRRAAVSDNASVGASDMAPTLQRSDAGQQQASSTAETAPAASGGALFTPQHATAPPDLVLRPTIARASAGQQAPLGASEPTPAGDGCNATRRHCARSAAAPDDRARRGEPAALSHGRSAACGIRQHATRTAASSR